LQSKNFANFEEYVGNHQRIGDVMRWINKSIMPRYHRTDKYGTLADDLPATKRPTKWQKIRRKFLFFAKNSSAINDLQPTQTGKESGKMHRSLHRSDTTSTTPRHLTAIMLLAIWLTTSWAQANAAPAVPIAYAYGTAPLQQLDYARPTGSQPAPLLVFVHGGGWQRGDKASATGPQQFAHWTGDGYAFASINYRLVPNATVEQQAADVAAALAWLRGNAERLGIDTTRIVLMGHSAGAHLVALVGTDPQYLAAAGMALSDLSGIIALDGAGYDVARQMADSGRLMRATYLAAFGTDAARQRQLSPTLQAAAPNAPAFLLVHVDRADG
jgi:acetyl esterase/lipase